MSKYKTKRKKFGELLIADGIILRDHLEQALDVQKQTGETLGEILLREGIISETDIVRCICTQYQLPLVRPANYESDAVLLDKFSVEFLYPNRILPLEVIGNCTIVALGEILSEEVENTLAEALGNELYFYFAPSSEIEVLLRSHFQISQEQTLSYDDARRARHKRGDMSSEVALPKVETPTEFEETLNNSWQNIFDEADENIG